MAQEQNRRENDPHAALLARLDERTERIVKDIDELKSSDREIRKKIDALSSEANQAKGASKALEWISKNWPALGASLVAAAAFFKDGGPPGA